MCVIWWYMLKRTGVKKRRPGPSAKPPYSTDLSPNPKGAFGFLSTQCRTQSWKTDLRIRLYVWTTLTGIKVASNFTIWLYHHTLKIGDGISSSSTKNLTELYAYFSSEKSHDSLYANHYLGRRCSYSWIFKAWRLHGRLQDTNEAPVSPREDPASFCEVWDLQVHCKWATKYE